MHKDTLCFDIGNVICHVKFDNFINVMVDSRFCKREEVMNYLETVQASFDLGIYNIKQSLKIVKSNYYTGAAEMPRWWDDLIYNAWLDVVKPSDEIIELINTLSNKYNIHLLSNIGFDHAKYLDSFEFFKNSNKHYSCYVGARKPNKLFYQSFYLDNTAEFASGSKRVFFDDRIENLEGSSGMFLPVRFNLCDYESDALAAKDLKSKIDDIFS